MMNHMKHTIARIALAFASFAVIVASDAQVINPSQPATGVPTAGTGISVSGQQVSVNYGVANSPFTGNLSANNITGSTSITTPLLTATAATMSGTTTLNGPSVLTGTVSGAGIAAYINAAPITLNVDNIAALRLTTPVAQGNVSNVASYYAGWAATTMGPIGGGLFSWNATSTTADDGWSTIKVTAITTGRWLRLNKQSLPLEAFGAKGGTVDDSAAFALALASGVGDVYGMQPSYTITTKQVVPAGVNLHFGGYNYTTLNLAANVVGIELLQYATLRGVHIAPNVTHTSNCVEVGDVTLSGDRSVISEVWVSGCGADGIKVRNGNLGTLRNIIATSNVQDGVEFGIEGVNQNAWKMEGTIDVRANTRDGFHLSAGASISDPHSPRANSGNLIVAQSNGRYGVYIGTVSNTFVIYGEVNTTKDLFLDTFGTGNEITMVNGTIQDTAVGFNIITTNNPNGAYWREFTAKTLFAGGVGKGIRIDNTDSTAGQFDIEKTAAAQLTIQSQGTSQDGNLILNNSVGGFGMNINIDGIIFPVTDNTRTLGTASKRWSTMFANQAQVTNVLLTGAPATTSAGQISFGAAAGATATIGAAGAPPAQVAGYIQASVNGTLIKIPYYNN